MIQELIDKHIAQLNDAELNSRTPSGKFSPSLLGACEKRQYLNKIKAEVTNPPDERAYRVFHVGRMFHDFVQKFFDDAETEVACEDELCKGYADIVTEDTVIDLKSQHSRSFWYMKKTDDILTEKMNNWLQAGWYAKQLKKPKVSLVFISKDDLCIAEYTLPYEKIEPHLEEELYNLSKITDEPEKNPRLYGGKEKEDKKTRVAKECSYCNWKDYCGGYIVDGDS